MDPKKPVARAESAVTRTDQWVAGARPEKIGARIYRGSSARPKLAVLHLHGGSFVAGSLDSGDAISTLLAEAGATVVSIDYPLAPEHPFPQALDAAFDVLTHVARGCGAFADKKATLYVAGEEAGGNIAAALALMARDQRSPVLAGQILLSPMLDPALATCSVREAKAGPAGCQWGDGWHQYLGSPAKAAHPYASPVGSSRLAGVAPALLITAEDDLLRDETLHYARRLRESGVAVRQHILSAPTGWPCALLGAGDRPAAEAPPWANVLRELFKTFFADTASPAASASSPFHVPA